MRRPTLPIRTSAVLALCAGTVQADITPAEAWAGLSAYMTDSGYDVDWTEEEVQNGLRLTGVVMSMETAAQSDGADVSGLVTMDVGEILLEDRGDGTVAMTLPSTFPIVFEGAGEEAPDRLVIDVMQTGLETVISGSPGDLVYEFDAERYAMRLSELVVEGRPASREEVTAEATIEALEGRLTSAETDDGRRVVQDLRAGTVSYDITGTNPDDGARVELAGRLADVDLDGEATLPSDWNPQDADAMAAAGLSGAARLSYSDGSTEFVGSGPDGEAAGQSVSDRGSLSIRLEGGTLAYDIAAEGIAYALTLAELPVPLTAEADEIGFGIEAPLGASEDPKPFSLNLLMADLSLSETIWSLIDPGDTLPHDPATVALDLSGMLTPFVDLFDPEAIARVQARDGVAGEINSVTLDRLRVSAAGAELTGEGAFTLDNSDLETFGGLPAPEGEATLNLSGANALIDALVSMGIVGQDEAMGARMMLSMFTVPGTGPDTLTSTVEVTEDGRILANGQRIR